MTQKILKTQAGQLAYTRTGRGPAVLLIHGCGVVGNGWRPQIDGLADRFDLIAFDNRGIGASALTGPLSVEGMAADALAILDAEGIGRAHLVGHSLGGLIAQHIALTTPERVASVALLCTFARGKQGAQVTPAMLLTALRMRIGTRAMRRRAFLHLVMPREYLATVDTAAVAEQLKPLFGRDVAENPSIMLKQVAAMSRYDASARFPEWPAVPTLVATALHDRIARPEFGRELAAALPGSRLVEWRNAGHAVTIQHAAEVNRVLAEHLSNGK